MLNRMDEILKKKYIWLYILLTVVSFLFSVLFVKIKGTSFKNAIGIIIVIGIVPIIYILAYIIKNYFILKLIRVNVKFSEIHNNFAWLYMLRIIISPLLYFFLLNNLVIGRILSNLVSVLVVLFQVYIINQKYGINTIKCIAYVIVDFLFSYLGTYIFGTILLTVK